MNGPGQHRSLANECDCACSDIDATGAIAYKLIVSRRAIKERWPPVIGPGGPIQPNKHVSCFLYSQISLVYMRCFTLVVFEVMWQQTFSYPKNVPVSPEDEKYLFCNVYQARVTTLQGNWSISAQYMTH